MAKLIITRSSEWVNRQREIGVYIDGTKTGTIWNGEIREFDIAPGKHTLACKIDWCVTQKFNFTITEDSDIASFNLSTVKLMSRLPLIGIVIFALHLLARAVFHVDYVFLLALPMLPVLAYYLTLGSSKYLVLEEIKL